MLWLKKFYQLSMVFRNRRAGVALIVAMATPLLIAITGLAVDAGYWYQQQENLQSAADAAALNAAMNDQLLAQSSNATKASAALPGATAAANNATNNQFGLVAAPSGAPVVSLTASMNTPAALDTQYVATVQIPRGGFFSKVLGPGLTGLGAGYQTATATAVLAAITTGSAPACLYLSAASAQRALYATGGAKINASGCPIYVNSTACPTGNSEQDAVVADPSAQITTSAISSPGCIYANTNGGAYIGNANNSTAGNLSHAAAQADPLAGLGTPPPWPTMPATPSAPTGTTYTAAPSLGYNTYSGAAGDCTYMGNYTANCELTQGAYSGMNSLGLNSLVLNENTSSGTTYITGGFSINANNFLTLNGSTYYIINGMSLTDGGTANIYASNLYIKGGTTLQNGKVNLGVNNTSNTYYFTGPYVGYATGWGLDVNLPTVNFGPGTYYVDGGAEFPGSNPVASLGQGTYLFSAYTNTSSGNQNTNSGGATGSGGALNDNNANITFTGGTYFFNGGLSLQGNATAYFGPGIYYIKNGDLAFANGSHVTANGATFVLEGNASYQLDGGTAALNLTAPTTNCVNFSNYPISTYSLPSSSTALPNAYAPYDGTNGEGICGILIYQAHGDTTADVISEGANSTITGIIYARDAALSISGGATLSSAVTSGTAGTLALIQSTLSLTGSGTLNLNVASGSALAPTLTTTYVPLLTN